MMIESSPYNGMAMVQGFHTQLYWFRMPHVSAIEAVISWMVYVKKLNLPDFKKPTPCRLPSIESEKIFKIQNCAVSGTNLRKKHILKQNIIKLRLSIL